jgi:hypothetical protein
MTTSSGKKTLGFKTHNLIHVFHGDQGFLKKATKNVSATWLVEEVKQISGAHCFGR